MIIIENINELMLLIPDKYDEEREAVAKAWEVLGGSVVRIAKFWEPPKLDTNRIKLYGNHIFCMVLAQKYNLKLISPDDGILIKISDEWTKRKLKIDYLSNTASLSYPIFIKPLVPKLFSAKQYLTHAELCEECKQLEGSTEVIISEIVAIKSEARAFVKKGEVMCLALYEGEQDINSANQFLKDFINKNLDLIPITCVIDLGYIDGRGWSILELNATWGAGLNGCDPKKVSQCLALSTNELT